MISNKKIKRILLVDVGAIGDIILATPAITALRQKLPDAWIGLLLKNYTKGLFEAYNDVDALFTHPFAEKNRLDSKKELFDFTQWLKELELDAIVFFNYLHWSQLAAAALARIPVRIGDSSRILNRPFFTVSFLKKERDLVKHEVGFSYDFVRYFGIDGEPGDLIIQHLDTDLQKKDKLIEENRITPDDIIVGVQPSTGGWNRIWPPEDYAEAVNLLAKQYPIKCVVSGTEDERFKAACKVPVIDLIGKTTIGELAAFMKRYNLYMSVDTGPFHLAAACKVPMVGIFPVKHVRPLRWGPWGTRQIVLKNSHACTELACKGTTTCLDATCVKAITPKMVADAAAKLLNGESYQERSEIFKHWFFLSITTLFVVCKDDSINEQAKSTVLSYQKQGAKTVFLVEEGAVLSDVLREKALVVINMPGNISSKKSTISYIAELLSRYDINIIQMFNNRRGWSLRLASALTGLQKVPFPAILLKHSDICWDKSNLVEDYVRAYSNL